ncbi:hypothetical protein OROHE_000837 [Orobanche hederae]
MKKTPIVGLGQNSGSLMKSTTVARTKALHNLLSTPVPGVASAPKIITRKRVENALSTPLQEGIKKMHV